MNLPKLLTSVILASILLFRLSSMGSSESQSAEGLVKERFYLSETINNILPQPQSALLAGILIGAKQDLPQEFKKALTNTSTIHIVVASGQNLTFVSGFFLCLAPLVGRKKSVLISFTAIIFYLFLAGFQIPLLRAAVMLTLASIAKLLNREADTWWILSLTVVSMLIFEPSWINSISFQLSVLATIAVVILAPEVIKRITFLPEIIKENLVVSLCAQLLTLPIIASNFYQISFIGVIVNALVLWTIPIIMLSGSIAVLAGLVNLTAGWLLALIPGVFLTYFVYVVNFFSIQFGSLTVGNISIFVWIGYYLLILAGYLYLKKANLSIP